MSEVFSGLQVSLIQVPESMAFAMVAHCAPEMGLMSSYMIMFLQGILGGRPGMITGCVGSLTVVCPAIVLAHNGPGYLYYAVILMGLFQIALGALRVGTLVKLIPSSVMVGFCNGLGLIICFSQFEAYHGRDNFKRRLGGVEVLTNFEVFDSEHGWIGGLTGLFAAIHTLIAFLICYNFPKYRWTKKIPAALAAIVVTTALEWAVWKQIGAGTPTIRNAGVVEGKFPRLIWDPDFTTRFGYEVVVPPLTSDTFSEVLPTAIILTVIGLLESLMTLNLVDDLTRTKGNPHRECVGLGITNFINGMFGGLGGCAMIGLSMLNIRSGARGRLSCMMAGVFLLIIVLVIYPAINLMPLAALSGVMFNVVAHTIEWNSLPIWLLAITPECIKQRCFSEKFRSKEVRRIDALVIFVTTVVTLILDLAFGVAAGLAVAIGGYVWESGDRMDVRSREEIDETGKVVKTYEVFGILFFGSTTKFMEIFDSENDPDHVVVIFDRRFVTDFSAVEAMTRLKERYEAIGKHITLEEADLTLGNGKTPTLLSNKSQMKDEKPRMVVPKHYSHHLEQTEKEMMSGSTGPTGDSLLKITRSF